MKPLEADSEQRPGNQLHDSFHDDFARGGIFSAGVHVRPGGPHLPRIRDHHRGFDFRLGPGLADAHAADVREAAEDRGDTASSKTGWSGSIGRGRETRSGRLREIAVVVPAPSLDFGADLGCLAWRARFCFSWPFPRPSCRSGDSSFIWGVMIGKEGSSPDQMHALAGSGGESHARGSRRRGDVHDDGQQPVPGFQSGTSARVSESAAGSRADSDRGGRA